MQYILRQLCVGLFSISTVLTYCEILPSRKRLSIYSVG